MPKRKTPTDYHNLAQQRGYTWLGPEAPGVHIKTGWRCSQGHDWPATYSNILIGSGCPECVRQRRYKQPADYHSLARRKGLQWLGPTVKGYLEKTRWQCPQGHLWQASYCTVRIRQGCPTCRLSLKRKKPAAYEALAKQRGVKWLGPAPKHPQASLRREAGAAGPQ